MRVRTFGLEEHKENFMGSFHTHRFLYCTDKKKITGNNLHYYMFKIDHSVCQFTIYICVRTFGPNGEYKVHTAGCAMTDVVRADTSPLFSDTWPPTYSWKKTLPKNSLIV